MHKETNQIELDGIIYIPVKVAAALTSYTSDYIGQLCRAGKVEATRIGRAWYVSENSIINHKEMQIVGTVSDVEKENDVEEKKARKRTAHSIFNKSSFVIYKQDKRPLLPSIKQYPNQSISIPIPESLQHEDADIVTEIVIKRAKIHRSGAKNKIKGIGDYVFRMILGTVSFAAVFMVIFSLNGSYTGALIGDVLEKATASVAHTELVKTIDMELVEPYRFVAREINETIDTNIQTFLYSDFIYVGALKR